MDDSVSDIPQLDVEVEVVQTRSNSLSATQVESQSTAVPVVEEKLNIPGQLNIHADSDDKNLNPVFGSMETIPLETSVHEETTNVSQNLENSTETFPIPVSSNANDLSKYFSTAPKQGSEDPAGINFFNSLVENATKTKDSFHTVEQEQKLVSQSVIGNEADIKLTDHDKDVENPILLKFFSEDKSGKDKDGKAFFDKISEEKVTGTLPALEINENILKAPSAELFLVSPSSSSEIEEAWIPSERTLQILISINTSNVSFSPDKNDLTMPSVIIEEEMEDSVKALLIECNSPYAHQRKVLTANDVSEDEAGLQKLMEAKCFHAVINLTKRLLTSCGQGLGTDGKPTVHTPLSLRLWYSRLASFVKLRKYSFAEVESAVFGDLDKCDLYYEFYPDIYKGKKGSMVPFALRLLLAELPQYQGNHQAALDNMYNLLNTVQKIISNVENGCAEDGSMIELSDARKAASLEIWRRREKRVLFSILNCVHTQKDYIIAVSVTNILISKSGTDTAQLHSALGRIYLQLGDVSFAEKCFKKAAIIAEENKQDFRVEDNINNALLSIASDENENAFQLFEQAYAITPTPLLVNNMAVCKLYTGQLKESLGLLESAIQKSPSSCLHDGLIFNVCTLYELESSRCQQKKLSMLELVSKYAGDSFNVNCLKIQAAKT